MKAAALVCHGLKYSESQGRVLGSGTETACTSATPGDCRFDHPPEGETDQLIQAREGAGISGCTPIHPASGRADPGHT